MAGYAPIGIFDSGYGGLTVYAEIRRVLPQYDYIYLGDNARMPYGDKSYDDIYEYTWQGVEWLFKQNCRLIVLACNTASARALRRIQNDMLPGKYNDRRVLGVIRPTAERAGAYTKTGHIAILGTAGTVNSNIYGEELGWYWPKVKVLQQACPAWVPIIEHAMHDTEQAEAVVLKDIEALLAKDGDVDVLLLGCTHYPLLIPLIKKVVSRNITVLGQNTITAESLKDYLRRHTWLDTELSRGGTVRYCTTGSAESFNRHANIFYNDNVKAEHIHLKNEPEADDRTETDA